jgi:hypothetical protein
MLARPVATHRAEHRPLAGAKIGNGEAGMGAADIGRNDLQRLRRPSTRLSTSDGSARVEVSPSVP